MNKLVIIVTLGLLTCATLQGCGGAQDRRARALERGQQFLAERNYAKARVEFSNALQIEPNDADARYLAAVAAEKSNDLRAAAQGYQGALNVDATHPRALAAMARLYVFSGLAEQSLELLDKGLAAHPDQPDLLVVRAAARMALNREQEALDDANAVLAKQPNHEYAVALLAGYYRSHGDKPRAVELVETALKTVPDSVDLRSVLAQLYVDLGDQARAEAELKKIAELRPTELEHRQRLAAFYAGTGREEQAEATLRDLIRLQPESVDFKLGLVNYLAGQKNFDAAEAELVALLKQNPNDGPLQLAAGQFYETHGLGDEAERVYHDVIAKHKTAPPGLSARDRVAAIRVRQGKVAEAQPLIDEVLAKNPRDNDALVLRATLALASGHTADAITDLRAVLRDQPDSAPLLRTLARSHAQNNEPDLARENYRHAVEADPRNADVKIEFAQYLNRLGDNAQARPLLEAVLKDEPNNVAALEALFGVLGAVGDAKAAGDVAHRIVVARPDNALGYYLEGLSHENAHDLAAARASYEKALEKEPRGSEPLGGLARVLLAAGQRDAVKQRLESVIAAYPDHAVALNMLAELSLSERAFDRAQELAERANRADARWWIPYRTKALALLAKGASADAKQAYEDGLKASGNAPPLGVDLAALYERESQPERAIEVYERLHASNPGSEPLTNNLAMLLTTYREDGVSHEKAGQLVRGFRNSTNPAYLNTYGWVRFRQGQVDEAVSYLRRASTALPENPVMHYHLGMALLASGDPAQARAELEKALASPQPFPGKDAAQRALESMPRTPG
jgi:tetratricopeptide (TPR) repeat protein